MNKSWGGILGVGGCTYEAHPVGAHAILHLGPLEPVSVLLTLHGEQKKVVPLAALSLLIFKASVLGEHHSDITHEESEVQRGEMISPDPSSEGGGWERHQRRASPPEPGGRSCWTEAREEPQHEWPQGTGHHSLLLDAQAVSVSTPSSLHCVVCGISLTLGGEGGQPATACSLQAPLHERKHPLLERVQEVRRKRLCHDLRLVRTFHNRDGALPSNQSSCTSLWTRKPPSKPIVSTAHFHTFAHATPSSGVPSAHLPSSKSLPTLHSPSKLLPLHPWGGGTPAVCSTQVPYTSLQYDWSAGGH